MPSIEGGGPRKPIALHGLPRPLRAIGYGLRIILLPLQAIAIVAGSQK
ncbi:hypothetical protein [Paenibacillus glycinis]|uniref:Uncharacterized protein n=1 Tax=Paenibacillus glycinis TaxID=2697035 RepID=A0ABW9XY53_9BACL|nr:hypothetical protein [Paenibacillus glycinis]NBD27645.1 hypothetical protein [Paenibacillus glycinis]